MQKINLLNEVNAVDKLYVYQKVARMNGNVISVAQAGSKRTDQIHDD